MEGDSVDSRLQVFGGLWLLVSGRCSWLEELSELLVSVQDVGIVVLTFLLWEDYLSLVVMKEEGKGMKTKEMVLKHWKSFLYFGMEASS